MKKYLVFVTLGKEEKPLVISSNASVDSENNVYFDMSNKLDEAVVFDKEETLNIIKASFSYNKDYKIRKYTI